MILYLKLALRKAKLAAAGLLAAFALSLVIAPLTGRAQGYSRAQCLDAALLFWTLLGVPVAALILGGSAGAETGASAELEAPLPLSSERRAFGSLASAALLLGAFCLVVAIAAGALHADWRRAGLILIPGMEPALASYLSIIVLVALFAVVLAFGVALATGSGAAGGLTAGALAAALHAMLLTAFFFHALFPARGSFRRLAFICGALILGAAGRATLLAARQARLRAASWRFGARLAGLIVLSMALVLLSTRVWIERFVSRLQPFDGLCERASITAAGDITRRMCHDGPSLSSSLRGKLVENSEGGPVVLVPERSGPAEGVLSAPFRGAGNLFVMKDGSWWLVRRLSDATELWTGRSGAPFKLVGRLPPAPWIDGVADGPRGPELLGWAGSGLSYAPLDLTRPLRWRPVAVRRLRR